MKNRSRIGDCARAPCGGWRPGATGRGEFQELAALERGHVDLPCGYRHRNAGPRAWAGTCRKYQRGVSARNGALYRLAYLAYRPTSSEKAECQRFSRSTRDPVVSRAGDTSTTPRKRQGMAWIAPSCVAPDQSEDPFRDRGRVILLQVVHARTEFDDIAVPQCGGKLPGKARRYQCARISHEQSLRVVRKP